MKRYIVGILLISLIACNDSKQNRQINTQVPEVEFDFSDMPKNKEIKPDTYVNDLEKIFTKEQNTELENYYSGIKKGIVFFSLINACFWYNFCVCIETIPTKTYTNEKNFKFFKNLAFSCH